MINFYEYYNNRRSLDNAHYFRLIQQLDNYIYTSKLKPIEHIIKKDTTHITFYSRNVIKGRWPAAEPYIIKSPVYAYTYAVDVIKGRWLEAEEFIMSDEYWWRNYCEDFKL